MDKLTSLATKMIEYDGGDPKRIQHFLKVHSLSRLIGLTEGLDAPTLFTLEAAALTHDIGIRRAEILYGRCDGPLQEQLGPEIARPMLESLAFPPDVTDRVCYLIAHHHTYDAIDGKDYQILVEADFLVNLYEDGSAPDAIRTAYTRIFRTWSGRELCRTMFGIEDQQEDRH